jgi:MarR family transcriptional regulator, organic hydroperoxide resistance regulator
MPGRPGSVSAAALRAAQALRAFGPEYKRWVDSRLPGGAGITSARLQALAMLTEHGPLTMVALSRRIGTTAHNVTKLVDWLELEGLVERRKDEHDRRAVTLHVTGKGRDTERRLAQAHMEAVAEALTDLPDPDLHELTDLLDRLRMAMRQRLI